MTELPGPGEPWTVLRLVRWSADYLEGKGIDRGQARLDAEHLLADALDTTRLQLYLHFDRPLTPDELAAFKPGLLRRAKREPLQYVLGRAAFRELDLAVDRRVLIPRPETEELVEAVLEWARERTGADRRPSRGSVRLPWSKEETASAEATGATEGGAGSDGSDANGSPSPAVAAVGVRDRPGIDRHGGERTLRALDLGTGSGCIALSLALEGPFRSVTATDVSADALELARRNARAAGLDDRVTFRHGDLWDGLAGTPERFDVVVSNPPYVADYEDVELAPEIREYEPRSALFAGPQGTELLERLVEGAAPRLEEGGLLALEVGAGQTATVAAMIRATGAFEEPRVRRDLSGRPRFALAVRGSGAEE